MTDTPETAILAALPATNALNRTLRNALLNTLHAAQHSEIELDFFANWLAMSLEDTPRSVFWYGPLAATELASRLEGLAQKLRQAASAIEAAKPFLLASSDSERGTRVGNTTHLPEPVRPPAAVPTPKDPGGSGTGAPDEDDTPF